ncbi:hypothetical protein [Haloarchaeobius sp. DYHT-AS-18]|uniref:hypothetical protein n=1 Tax=Haloarchaeobius sp. DYHT-AS-18 TaxID=3446117 RepID=UPI003EB8F7F9
MLSALLDALRERRLLVLWLSLLVGIGAGAGAYVTLGDSNLVLPLVLGVGGTAYYSVYHGHRLSMRQQDFGRGFVRMFALITLVDLVTTGDGPFGQTLWTAGAVAGLALVFGLTMQLDQAKS